MTSARNAPCLALRGRLSAALLLIGLAAATPALAERPRVYAITGARLVVAPGTTIDDGVVVMRDGLIEAAGAAGRGMAVPPDAVVIDAAGRTVTAGFIDACSDIGLKKAEAPAGPSSGSGGPRPAAATEPPPGTSHPLPRVRPERRAVDSLVADASSFEKHRAMGFTTALTLPAEGIFRGQPAVVNLGSGSVPSNVLVAAAGQVIAFESGSFGQGYPSSLMGSIAAIRQTFLDAQRHAVWQARYQADPAGMKRPESVAAYAALADATKGSARVFFDTPDSGNVIRALALIHEHKLDGAVIGSGLESAERNLLEAIAASGRPFVLPLAYPEKPKVTDPDEALAVTTMDLERWDMAPANPAAFQQAGLVFSLGTCRAPSASEFPGRLRKAMERGLSEKTAFAALTLEPARLLGLEKSLGTVEAGKIANVVLWDGVPSGGNGIFDEKAKPRHVFVDGVKHDIEAKKSKGDPNAKVDPRGTWSITLTVGGRTMNRTWTITGEEGNYSGTAETQRGTVTFSSVTLAGNEMTVVLPADGSRPSSSIAVIVTGDTLEGEGEFPGGGAYTIKGTRTSGPEGGIL